MKKYELIVFDWDGTLYDSSAFIVKCVQQAAEQMGFAIPAAETITQMIGLSVEKATDNVLPELSPMQKAEYIRVYREQVSSIQEKPCLFSGAVEVLKTLKARGFELAIATGKGSAGLKNDLELLEIEDLFSGFRCGDQTFSKPNPAMLNELLEELGVAPEKALVVGDTEYDMLMAKNADVDAVAASYGVHELSRLDFDNVKHTIHDIKELLLYLS